ncbi:MAG: VOC family protein [Solirubrobacterales bacterium]|nr:VOC family protein [Solirubrobacterales bacterium]
MGLGDCNVDPVIAVSDLSRSREFYEGRLGLVPIEDDGDGGCLYGCGEGTGLYIYPSPGRAGKTTATMAGWTVPDLDAMIAELEESGVPMVHYDEPGLKTDEKGIFSDGDHRIAWFQDPDGNTFAIEGE